ncbi:MAG TPA: hypothetical protein VET45_09385 [Candidatus Binatia bacterium]|nr:hypothetical protein [Candidatus Binatia bacterium]
MKRLQAAGLSVTLACLALVSPVSAAGKYDGSRPMLCAVTAVSECTADGKCERSAPHEGNNLPAFLRVDLKGRLLTDNDGSGRKTEIKTSSVVDGQLMLQGGENGKGWTMVIGSETGRWGGSIVEDDGLFAVFGVCTLP